MAACQNELDQKKKYRAAEAISNNTNSGTIYRDIRFSSSGVFSVLYFSISGIAIKSDANSAARISISVCMVFSRVG
jgi:hypothetical protein